MNDFMQQDIRETVGLLEMEALYQSVRQSSAGLVSDVIEIIVSADERQAIFSGVTFDESTGGITTRLFSVDLLSGELQIVTSGPNTDRSPAFSPDGGTVAFLSDRHKTGDFQLFFLDMCTHDVVSLPRVTGWVEAIQWSVCGQKVLLSVAGHGADTSSGQGAITSNQGGEGKASWMPDIQCGDESYRWRSTWIYNRSTKVIEKVSPLGINIWEASWCGHNQVAVIASTAPTEAAWYSASLGLIDIASGQYQEIYQPKDQLGGLKGSPEGTHIAFIEAICSDRGLIAGNLLIFDRQTNQTKTIQTNSVDITHSQWRSESELFLSGHRGAESVVLEYDLQSEVVADFWSNTKLSGVGRYLQPVALGDGNGDCLFIAEGFLTAPEIGKIHEGHYETIVPFNHNASKRVKKWISKVESITWQASDGVDIQGWLLRPHGTGPFPLLMEVHGGPVWHWRPRWLPRSNLSTLMLLKKGYAIFLPNPRGSTGRGQDFVRRVQGDMGGQETYDFLSGLDYLVEKGIADPKRLGVTGGSYGGFMTSWLITQDSRFAAAVPVAPVTHWASKHLTTYIPAFDELFLNDKYNNPDGRYHQRSPVMHAHKAKTPTLHICGALDRCTPPGQAMEFHNALLEHGVESVLVTYPEEGHGVRKYPAVIDYATRVVAWFDTQMAAK